MSKFDVLKATRALLADPAHWTQGAWARDGGGGIVPYSSSSAICWCLVGAVMRCAAADQLASLDARAELSRAAVGGFVGGPTADCIVGLETFNDSRGHAAVLALLDSVIAQEQPNAA